MYFPIGWSKTLKIRLKSYNSFKNTNDTINVNSKYADNKNLDQENDSINEETLDCDEKLLSIKTSSDKSFLCVLTNLSLRLWFCKPAVEIVSHFRSKTSLKNFGFNQNVTWKPDSSMIIVQTTLDYLLFYKVILNYDENEIFVFNQPKEPFDFRNVEKIPALLLDLSFYTQISSGISSIMAAEEEAIICTKKGEIIGVNWDATFDENFNWNLKDSQYSASNPNLSADDDSTDNLFYVINHEYSSAIGGFSLVFANGKAAFLPLKNEETESSNNENQNDKKYFIKKLNFVNEVDNAIVTAINHKYQLLTFGLKNSEAILCYIDDLTNTVLITHHLSLSASSFPNANNLIGSLTCLQWSPDSSVLAASWEKGGFVIWSVFGSLLSCSLSWDNGSSTSQNKNKQIIYDSLSWGKEGYQLWTLEKSLTNQENDLSSKTKFIINLCQFSMVKSILVSNPSCISNCGEHVLLIGEDRLYLGFEATNSLNQQYSFLNHDQDSSFNDNLPSTNTANIQCELQSTGLGNHQWIIIPMPPSYYNSNFPIKYASIDQSGQYIAIAGKNGFALYSTISRKWKLFGNESQEKDFEVCGGLIWYKDMVVLGCFNLNECCFEIRVYSLQLKLDNQNAKILKVPCDILLMSINKNHLLVFLLDSTFYLYEFSELKKIDSNSSASSSSINNQNFVHKQISSSAKLNGSNSKVNISSFHLNLIHQIFISNVIVPPECVTSILLSSLHFDSVTKQQNDSSFTDLILMNVCGRLFLLEIDFNKTANLNKKNNQSSSDNETNTGFQGIFSVNFNSSTSQNKSKTALVYKVVSVLASGVENVWVNNNSNEINEKEKRPHLSNALWLACGMNGMGVWLPLLSNDKNYSQSKSFIAKRIMLPISTHIYPLAVLFRDALVLGAENDTITCGKNQISDKPFNIVSKTSQVYLHHILRELLRRNLGIHAWEIANSCSSLPYFPHSLELLLHGVLEEEATSSQAIPDPLLPRVIQFIREFPVFLETVVHCARKTELALWPHLFSIVGNPKDLFQQCLNDDKLLTAASYIIVLHNLEKKNVSKQFAITLLNKAIEKGESNLVKDLNRFLNAIEPSELSKTSYKANKVNTNIVCSYNSKYMLSHSSVNSTAQGDTNHHIHTHNQILHLSQHNLNQSKNSLTTNRKRTQSTSSTLMLQNSMDSHSNVLSSLNLNNDSPLDSDFEINDKDFKIDNSKTLTKNLDLSLSSDSLASVSTNSVNNQSFQNSTNNYSQKLNNHNSYDFFKSLKGTKIPNKSGIVPPGGVAMIHKHENNIESSNSMNQTKYNNYQDSCENDNLKENCDKKKIKMVLLIVPIHLIIVINQKIILLKDIPLLKHHQIAKFNKEFYLLRFKLIF